MSTLSRVALVVVASAIGCSEPTAPGPSPTSGAVVSGARALPAPTGLDARFVGGNSYVVISWLYSSTAVSEARLAGFVVERAPIGGPWLVLGFTEQTEIGDTPFQDGVCYRVTAVTDPLGSDLDSQPSQPVCVAPSRV